MILDTIVYGYFYLLKSFEKIASYKLKKVYLGTFRFTGTYFLHLIAEA